VPSDPMLSAEVVLGPAGGPQDTEVTAATLADHAPDPEAARHVADHLRGAGFDVGDLIGISFPVTARRSRFEEVFGAPLTVGEETSGTITNATTVNGELELPLDRLPEDVRRAVIAVTFTAPPDFGPGDFR
jgi:hypothetical protein